MGDFWTMAGGQALSAGLGLALAPINDARQLRQQRKLQDLQIKGSKEMMQFSTEQQLDIWNRTNYPAQVAQLKAAGLNPGLLYGMGGAGGSTVGNPSGAVQGADAPKGGREVQDMLGMGLQMQLLEAQKENIEANTNKTNVEANKIGGVETQLNQQQIAESKAREQNIMAQTTTEKAKAAGQELVNHLQQMENKFYGETLNDRIQQFQWDVSKTFRELQILDDAQYVSHATRLLRIDQAKADLANSLLENVLIGANITNINKDTWLKDKQGKLADTTGQLNRQNEKYLFDKNWREWDQMSEPEKERNLRKALQERGFDQENLNSAVDMLKTIIGAGILRSGTGGPTYIPLPGRTEGHKQ